MADKSKPPRKKARVLGPMATRAQQRPKNYEGLDPQRQWEIDSELGILDWDGSEDT